MAETNLPNFRDHEGLSLQMRIKALQNELDMIEQKANAFEALLRSRLANEIIEVQELTVIYKKLKKAKKEKRLEQKRRGKNYKEPVGIRVVASKKEKQSKPEEQKEIKRLYREAMLHVHPDKFSMNEEKIDLATEITSKLIDIYQSGDLLELQFLHKHITSGNAMNGNLSAVSDKTTTAPNDVYLKRQYEKLVAQLERAKCKHTYKVLTEYPDPMLFVEELKIYYTDKIAKLRKRTRKANK